MRTALQLLAIFYLACLLGLWVGMARDDGTSWWITLFLFSPRWAVGIPLIVLVPWALWDGWRRASWRSAIVALLLVCIFVFPILGFQIPEFSSIRTERSGRPLRIISCNLGESDIHIDQLVAFIQAHKAEVVMLAECPKWAADSLFEQLGWNKRQLSDIVIGSSMPLDEVQRVASLPPEQSHRSVSIACNLHLTHKPSSPTEERTTANQAQMVRLVAVHFPTFRPAFEKARSFDGEASTVFEQLRTSYRKLAETTLQVIQEEAMPTIIAGDFNVPPESAFYRDYWQSFQNALSIRGLGWCYTKYTRLHGIRIDHVVVDRHWAVQSAHVGAGLGGDHRPVIVDLVLQDQPH